VSSEFSISGGMKSSVSAHYAQQLDWRHVLRHVR